MIKKENMTVENTLQKPKVLNGQVWISELDAWVSIEDHLEAIMMNVNESLLEYDDGEEFVNMKNIQSCDSKGNHWEEPYLNTGTQKRSEIVVDALNGMGIFAEIDLYEDDDGEGDGGRPIIIQRWSVKLGIKINETYQG